MTVGQLNMQDVIGQPTTLANQICSSLLSKRSGLPNSQNNAAAIQSHPDALLCGGGSSSGGAPHGLEVTHTAKEGARRRQPIKFTLFAYSSVIAVRGMGFYFIDDRDLIISKRGLR